MPFRIFLMLSAAVLGGGWYLSSQADSHDTDEARYAEISTTTPPVVISATSSAGTIVPILVYHIVRPSYPTDSEAVRRLAVTPEIFDAEMKYLGNSGYHVIRFSDLDAHLKEGRLLPDKPVVLTFDDGWRDQYKYAFPILKKYQYPTTFFVFTNAIGRKAFLSWDELREMSASGMTVGGHTRSHPYLTRIRSSAVLWDEIYGSKLLLEKKLGVTVSQFAYPFGMYNASTTALVENAGYTSARGDYQTKSQSLEQIFELGALNAPTTIEQFIRIFP